MEWRGFAYIFLWYLSIASGFLILCCPTIPLLFIYPELFRFIIGIIYSVWEMYPTVLMRLLFKTEFVITGDHIKPKDGALILMNHRNRLDWNFLWACMYYGTEPPAHKLKMVLKSAIRHVPFVGWVMQMSGFLYIQRRWDHDQSLMADQLKYFSNVHDTNQILLFPEGTDLSLKNIELSNIYAEKNNFPKYRYVLHPKTTGFVFLTDTMRKNKQIEAVYDITIGYPDLIPQNEIDALCGVFPKNVHFHIKRYDISDLPKSTDGLKLWLIELWSEKEKRLAEFTLSSSFVSNSLTVNNENTLTHNSLYLSFMFWTLIEVITVYNLITSSLFQYWCLIFCIIFVGLSFVDDGFQMLEVKFYNRFKHPKKNR
ncbi:lysocardiolipin acyltransferase 1-like isoform X2 [Daktulosphaira vitifoliae]|uniref:lysocardiolipin acyltransferase 1-like isoform X2 n=1 Tax=Daktulosphaira vitifoliae TaxID=58002 RepID=UPI0021AAC177|nr:lysocardiolipin acyltransferase 1-like isoform X2 [Daktulosphaira vitifoliae]